MDVVIVDDQEIRAVGLVSLLAEYHPQWRCHVLCSATEVIRFGSLHSSPERLAKGPLQVGVVIVTRQLRGSLDAFSIARRVRAASWCQGAKHPRVRLILSATRLGPIERAEAQAAGFWACYETHLPVSLLLAQIRSEAPELSDVEYTPLRRRLGFTDRQWEVLQLLRQGLSNGEISEHLQVAVSTVRVHLRHSYSQLKVRSRTQAVKRLNQLMREYHE